MFVLLRGTFFLLCVIFGTVWAAAKKQPCLKKAVPRYEQRAKNNLESSLVHGQDKHFVVIVPSYNNEKYLKRNLDSIFMQRYPAALFRVVYVDDCSSDKTPTLVEEYKKEHKLGDRLTIIHNHERRWMAYNRFVAAKQCKSDDVIIHVDGDDWLSDHHVLEYINYVYKDTSIWMTYGQYSIYPSGELGYCGPIPEVLMTRPGLIRKNIFWRFMHLRTCYAWLFNLLPEADFKINGQWLTASTDVPMMWGLIELAGRHYKFISRVLYVLNRENSLNVQKSALDLQLHNSSIIAKRKAYQPLPKPQLTLNGYAAP